VKNDLGISLITPCLNDNKRTLVYLAKNGETRDVQSVVIYCYLLGFVYLATAKAVANQHKILVNATGVLGLEGNALNHLMQ
jgi:hypothetical protein